MFCHVVLGLYYVMLCFVMYAMLCYGMLCCGYTYVNRCEFLHSMVQKLHVLDFCVIVAEMLKSVDKTTWNGEAVLGSVSESVDKTTKSRSIRPLQCSVDKTNLASTDFLFAALERCLQEGAERSWMASTDLLSAAGNGTEVACTPL